MNATSSPAPQISLRDSVLGIIWRYVIVAVLSVSATIGIAAWRDRLGIEARVSANAQQVTELERRMAAQEARHEELMKVVSEYARHNSERYGSIDTRLALIEQLVRGREPR